jgi:hypothetical protein
MNSKVPGIICIAKAKKSFLKLLERNNFFRNSRDFFRNSKALSPIFATLIILSIVTVLFIPVFIWATGISSQTEDSWQFSGQVATERIVVEEVNFVGGVSIESCTIYVRNIGETAVTINDAIISIGDSNVHTYQKLPATYPVPPPQPPQQLSTYDPTSTPAVPTETITKGNLIEIRIPNLACLDHTFKLVNETTYTVKVFTTRGVSDTYQVMATWYTP